MDDNGKFTTGRVLVISYGVDGRNGAHSRTPWQTSSSQAARAANARKN